MVKSMRVRSHSYRCSIQPELMIQQPRAPPKQNKDGSWPDPKIAWCKGKTFALALIVDHQEHRLKNSGEYVADWDCILPVVNDVYPRICTSAPKFSDIYPAGLPNANKLRSHYSDRYRTRKSKKWQIKKIDCTPEEIVELEKIAKIVLDAETRLNGLRVAGSDGNIVRDHRAEVKLPNGVPATIWPSDPVIGETLKKKSTGTRKNTKRKRKSEEHESGDEGIEEEEEEEGEEESTAARKKSTATRKSTPTRKTSAPKSRKRKYKSEEELEEEAAQDGESEEYIQAPTARSSLNCRVLPDDRLGTSRLFNKFDSDDEDNEMDNDNEDDADKASVARPTTGGETVVGERSHGPHQNSFEFNYDLSTMSRPACLVPTLPMRTTRASVKMTTTAPMKTTRASVSTTRLLQWSLPPKLLPSPRPAALTPLSGAYKPAPLQQTTTMTSRRASSTLNTMMVCGNLSEETAFSRKPGDSEQAAEHAPTPKKTKLV
jgi:hypothetical protein